MRLALFSILLVISFNAHSTWYYELTIRDVRAQNKAGQASFRTLEAVNNPSACPNYEYYGIRPENNPPLAMSVLLAAFMSGKAIDINVDDSQCDIYGSPSVKDVRIRN